MSVRDALPPVAVGAAAFATVFHRLDISVWFDEAFSWGIATSSWHSFFTRWVWGSESNMSLYYLLLRGWLGLLALGGTAPNELLLRLPSALFAVAAAVAVFWVGRHLFGWICGAVAGVLFTTNFLQMILAQNARAYSLQLLLLSLSWLFLFIALEKPRTRWWALYAVATALSFYASFISAVVIVSELAAMAALLVLPGPWQARIRASIRPLATSLAAAFVLIVPIGIDAVIHGGAIQVAPVHLGDVLAFFRFIGGGDHTYERVVFASMALGLVLAAAALFPRAARFTRAAKESFAPAIAVACWFAVPIVVSFALTQRQLNLHLFFPRYLVVVVPPMCLLAGLAVAAIPYRLVQAVLALALVVVAAPPLNLYYVEAQVQDFKDPVRWMQQRYQQGDGIVCAPDVQCGIPITYSLAADPGPAHLDADSPGRFSWEDGTFTPITPAQVIQYAGHHHRVFFMFGPLGSDATLVSQATELEAALTGDGFRLADEFKAHGSAGDTTVSLYESTRQDA